MKYWMCAATGGQKMKWGAHILIGGTGTTAPPRWRRTWCCGRTHVACGSVAGPHWLNQTIDTVTHTSFHTVYCI